METEKLIKERPFEIHLDKKGVSLFEVDVGKDIPKRVAINILTELQSNLFSPYTIIGKDRDNVRLVDQILALICNNIQVISIQTGQSGFRKYLKVQFIRSPYWNEFYCSALGQAKQLRQIREKESEF